MKQQIAKYSVESESSDKNWIITKYDDDSYSCNCPKWIFTRGKKVNCKHINKFLEQQQTLIIEGIEDTAFKHEEELTAEQEDYILESGMERIREEKENEQN